MYSFKTILLSTKECTFCTLAKMATILRLPLPASNLNMLYQKKSTIRDRSNALISWSLVIFVTYCPRSLKTRWGRCHFYFLNGIIFSIQNYWCLKNILISTGIDVFIKQWWNLVLLSVISIWFISQKLSRRPTLLN